ncbi:hypothetical protein [Sphingomonas sp. ABOLF]|nr:hypothetical protein [Sphingomonas sp. ABOLF]
MIDPTTLVLIGAGLQLAQHVTPIARRLLRSRSRSAARAPTFAILAAPRI